MRTLNSTHSFTLCLASTEWSRTEFMWRTEWSETRVDRQAEHEGRRSKAHLLAQTESCVTSIDQSINVPLNDASIHSHGVRPYHSVLVVDFNHNDWWVVPQLTGLPKELHIVKHQQLVPCRAKSLAQDLQHTHTYYLSLHTHHISDTNTHTVAHH